MAALAFSAGAAPVVLATQPAIVSATPRPVKAGPRSLFGGSGGGIRLFGHKGAGFAAAQVKRASAKKRAVARNRRHHR
jgi:hypothetical protein